MTQAVVLGNLDLPPFDVPACAAKQLMRKPPMITRPSSRTCAMAAAVIGGLTLAACATTPAPHASAEFSTEAFAWSAQPGHSTIEGRVSFAQNGQTYDCAGNVGLIPATGYTTARMQRLYGSTTRAAVPAAVVRARNEGEQPAEYRAFERAEACQNNSFRFTHLPEGQWFLISPVRSGDEVVVLMRQVQTRGSRVIPVTIGN